MFLNADKTLISVSFLAQNLRLRQLSNCFGLKKLTQPWQWLAGSTSFTINRIYDLLKEKTDTPSILSWACLWFAHFSAPPSNRKGICSPHRAGLVGPWFSDPGHWSHGPSFAWRGTTGYMILHLKICMEFLTGSINLVWQDQTGLHKHKDYFIVLSKALGTFGLS